MAQNNQIQKDDRRRDEDDLIDMWLYKLDRIKNRVIGDKLGVTPIEDKMKEIRLILFGRVKRTVDIFVKRLI